MSYIGNSPGVSSQRVVTEEVISGSPKSAFYPVGGYALGYVDVLINGLEVDSSDFTATDGVVVTLGTAAAVGDTVKIKAYIPRGLSDGYLKSEADAKFLAKTGGTLTGDLVLDNGSADGAQVVLKSLGYSNWNIDNYSGKLRAYYNATEHFNIDANGTLNILNGRIVKLGSATSAYLSTGDVHGDSNTLSVIGGDSAASALAVRLYNGGYWYPLQVKNTGDLQVTNGNLVLASGKGIDFSASSNAGGMTSEVLSDYEEGTWTPAYTSGTTNPTVTYAEQAGKYTKIGNVVYFSLRLVTASVSGGSGELRINLPFATVNFSTGIGGGGFVNFGYNFTSSGGFSSPSNIYVSAGNSFFVLKPNATDLNVLQVANLSASAYLNVTGFFYV